MTAPIITTTNPTSNATKAIDNPELAIHVPSKEMTSLKSATATAITKDTSNKDTNIIGNISNNNDNDNNKNEVDDERIIVDDDNSVISDNQEDEFKDALNTTTSNHPTEHKISASAETDAIEENPIVEDKKANTIETVDPSKFSELTKQSNLIEEKPIKGKATEQSSGEQKVSLTATEEKSVTEKKSVERKSAEHKSIDRRPTATERKSSVEIRKQKDQIIKELDALKQQIHKKGEPEDADGESTYDEDQFGNLLDTAFNSTTNLPEKANHFDLDDFNKFLSEHRKIDEKLVNTKQSKLFLIKSKTKRVKKSPSVSSLKSVATETQQNTTTVAVTTAGNRNSFYQKQAGSYLYELDNSSRATLPHKIIRRISTRKSRDNNSIITRTTSNDGAYPLSPDHALDKPPTLNEVSSETESLLSSEKEIITYKKVFKDNQELTEEEIAKLKSESKRSLVNSNSKSKSKSASASSSKVSRGKVPSPTTAAANDTTIIDDIDENIETFQFQFEFSKIKLDDEKLKFSDSIKAAVEKPVVVDPEEEKNSRNTTLISNSNGKVVTTTIKPKQSKKLFANLCSFFSWKKSS